VRKGSTNRTAHIVKRFHTFVKNTINVVLKKMKEKKNIRRDSNKCPIIKHFLFCTMLKLKVFERFKIIICTKKYTDFFFHGKSVILQKLKAVHIKLYRNMCSCISLTVRSKYSFIHNDNLRPKIVF